MNETKPKTYEDFVLPPSVVSRLDVSRLVSEVEKIDSEMTSAAIRARSGSGAETTPVLSEQLTHFLTQNKLELQESKARTELVKQLRTLKDKVPTIHMTFAVTADRESLQQLALWLRTSIHPQAVISVGLQPGLVAGVYLRTSNQIYDLSLKAKLASSRDVLIKEVEALHG